MKLDGLAFLLVLSLASGCGYVTHGSTQRVFIDTVPTGAPIAIDGKPYTTPVDLQLARGDHHTVTAQTTWGAPLASHIRSEIQWRYAIASFFLPPIIGTIIDGVTGGDCELVPAELVIPLDKPQPTR